MNESTYAERLIARLAEHHLIAHIDDLGGNLPAVVIVLGGREIVLTDAYGEGEPRADSVQVVEWDTETDERAVVLTWDFGASVEHVAAHVDAWIARNGGRA